MRNIGKNTDNTEKLHVLLAHEDENFFERVAQILQENENIELIGPAQNGDETVHQFERNTPELTILSMSLHGADGLSVAGRLRRKDGQAMLWLISSFMGAEVQRRCADMHIEQVFRSAVTPEVVGDRVLGWAVGFAQGQRKKEDTDFRGRAEALLRSFRLRSWTKGLEYMLEALCRSREGDSVLTKTVYMDIAKKYHTKRVNIERVIRYTVEQICLKGDPGALRRCLGEEFADHSQHLTTGQFIDAALDYLSRGEDG